MIGLKEELPRSVGTQYATGDQWRNNSRKNDGMEPKQKQYPAVDVTGDRSKVRCCKEQYCIGTWTVRSMTQGKLEAVKQEMARVNVDILGISELKWTGMGEFNSYDHYIYYCGQESAPTLGPPTAHPPRSSAAGSTPKGGVGSSPSKEPPASVSGYTPKSTRGRPAGPRGSCPRHPAHVWLSPRQIPVPGPHRMPQSSV